MDGDDIYINMVHAKLAEEADGIYELHRHYLDLHVDIRGRENVLFCDFDEAKLTRPYQEDGDYTLMKAEKTSACQLDSEHFVLCMLDEPHLPCVKGEGTGDEVLKAIVK